MPRFQRKTIGTPARTRFASATAWVVKPDADGNGRMMIEGTRYKFSRKGAVLELAKADGTVYEVAGDSCNCPGFKNRRQCKHVGAVTGLLRDIG